MPTRIRAAAAQRTIPLLCLLLALATAGARSEVIFTARSIITMDPGQPRATAIAVADGRVVAVGSERQDGKAG